ncbi:hypothetical protein [Aquaticitalea lipolytica]|uniref:hypothetical protein n=1 Tax=Aquaticitalea lipolytica TaxID=1247562 RepID=UPI0024BA055E|nr:hypothetical protein [Aquaticitalea lipolytica]
MKSILILFTLCLLTETNAQDKVRYTAPMIEIVMIENNEIVMRKPEGKNVKIEFDKFFKTYYITYYDDRGSYVYLNLSYLTGEMVNDEHVWRMHDQNKNYFIVADQIKTKNRLVITVETKLGGEMKAHYWISNTQLE